VIIKSFFRFMANNGGRLLCIVAGLGLIAWRAFPSPITNWVLIIIGLIPLSAGLLDFCVFAPLFGGRRLRSQVNG
jgi:hypothetical protein